jgi:hypothetical protein
VSACGSQRVKQGTILPSIYCLTYSIHIISLITEVTEDYFFILLLHCTGVDMHANAPVLHVQQSTRLGVSWQAARPHVVSSTYLQPGQLPVRPQLNGDHNYFLGYMQAKCYLKLNIFTA